MAAKAVKKTAVKLPFASIDRRVDDIAKHFETYSKTIQPFVIHIEQQTGKFPVEIFNEIRAIYSHLCRVFQANDQETVDENIRKINGHTKRALLDCYKNCCIIALERRKSFLFKI